jgi:urease beta subunit
MNWLSLLSGIPQAIATYFTRKAELNAQAHANDVDLLKAQGERQAQLASQGLTADANWEMEFARQAATSWKDEYTLIVVSIPAILAFVPGCSMIVAAGFTALALTPLWYQVMLVSIFFATYGIRYWRRTQSDT